MNTENLFDYDNTKVVIRSNVTKLGLVFGIFDYQTKKKLAHTFTCRKFPKDIIAVRTCDKNFLRILQDSGILSMKSVGDGKGQISLEDEMLDFELFAINPAVINDAESYVAVQGLINLIDGIESSDD